MPTEALTAALVDRLRRAPPRTPGRVEHWDSKTPGLCLRISATGAATWTFRYRPRNGGGYQRVTLGAPPAVGLADAREHAARLRGEMAGGSDPQRDRMARRAAAANAFTFDRLAQRYLDEYAKPRKASWRNDEIFLKRPRQAWGKRDAATITRRDAIELLDEIKRTAPVSANRTHSVLVTLFNWAVEDQLLDATPVAGLKKRAVESSKDRTLSDPEIRLLWRELETGNGMIDDVALALRALLLTGQRPGEVAEARRGELFDLGDPAEARWEIPAERDQGAARPCRAAGADGAKTVSGRAGRSARRQGGIRLAVFQPRHAGTPFALARIGASYCAAGLVRTKPLRPWRTSRRRRTTCGARSPPACRNSEIPARGSAGCPRRTSPATFTARTTTSTSGWRRNAPH